MPLTLPKAGKNYEQANEQTTRGKIESEDRANLKTGTAVDPHPGYFVIRSPSYRWKESALDNGALVLTSL